MITKNFEDFILQCFSGELRTAELRLSQEEKEYVSGKYRKARFKELDCENDGDGRIWYEVRIVLCLSLIR